MKCTYCDYKCKSVREDLYALDAFDQRYEIYGEIEWEQWIKELEKFAPYHLDITGGEPTLYKDLEHLLAHLEFRSKWSITSNTLNTEMIDKIATFNCHAWTASFHFKEDVKFISNLQLLFKKGIHVRVTMVLTPDNEKLIQHYAWELSKYCYGINIHPMLKKDFDWNDHLGTYNRIKAMHDGRNLYFVDTISKDFAPEKYDLCNAGSKKYCVLFPDGQMFKCYSQILSGKSIGNIKDRDVREDGLFNCDLNGCMFPCDKNYTIKEKKNDVVKESV